jgi:hypothetical protein
MEGSTMTTQISKLRKASLKELQEKYQEAFGKETKNRNRVQLFSQIARKLQNDEEPDSAKRPVPLASLVAKYEGKGRSKNRTKTATREKQPKSKVKPVGVRDPRLPKLGTTIEREYKGKKLHVTVAEDGFTFAGKSYKSLSALAAHITGAKAINGYLFFQLGDYAKKAGK